MPISLELMPLEEKAPEAPPAKTLVVRYGFLKEIGEFPSDVTSKIGCGTKLILRTDRGTEIGEMLTTTCGNGGCNKSITRDKLLDYIEQSGGKNYPFSEAGRVLRVATVQDLAEQAKLDEQRKKHVTLARELVARHNLAMKIVDVEYILGGERVLFYFSSELRIDFRNMVRDLAHDLHTRIEMRQVGSRDEARITADYEKCGQHCCCKQFLKVLTPISMRAAKVQKATLDPTKISGRCGRLMCCLRYEDETYEELRKKLPKRNTRVRAEQGDAWVIDGQILTQLVLLQFDDGKREAVPMEKILEFDRPKPLMADGRVMQTPNDRPPMGAAPMGGPGASPENRGRGPAPRGPGSPPNAQGRGPRPMPGAPAQAPAGDPLAPRGPTGGDLNTSDALDDLIADAMDAPPATSAPADPSAPIAAAPTPLPPTPPANRGPGGGNRPPMRGPNPQGGPPRPAPGAPQGNRGPGGNGPNNQGRNRGTQSFRPQQPRGPMPPRPNVQQPPQGGSQLPQEKPPISEASAPQTPPPQMPPAGDPPTSA